MQRQGAAHRRSQLLAQMGKTLGNKRRPISKSSGRPKGMNDYGIRMWRKSCVTALAVCVNLFPFLSNNTRPASAGFGLKRAPRRVTFLGAWS